MVMITGGAWQRWSDEMQYLLSVPVTQGDPMCYLNCRCTGGNVRANPISRLLEKQRLCDGMVAQLFQSSNFFLESIRFLATQVSG